MLRRKEAPYFRPEKFVFVTGFITNLPEIVSKTDDEYDGDNDGVLG